MKTYKIVVDIREKDIDGNKIDTKKELENIKKAIARFWNVESIK